MEKSILFFSYFSLVEVIMEKLVQPSLTFPKNLFSRIL